MTTIGRPRNLVLSTVNYDVVGTRPIRHDGADKVTGRAFYGADFHPTGLLHGKTLRSPHAHARIRAIDSSPGIPSGPGRWRGDHHSSHTGDSQRHI